MYIVMTATDRGKTFNSISAFAMHKGVYGIAGGDVVIKRQFNCDLYLPCKNTNHIIYYCVLCLSILPLL